MPIYENVALPYSIAPGESATPIVSTDNAQGALPFKSERVALLRGNNTTPQHLSAELQFSGTPGAYTWQIETADTDIDANYSIEGTVPISRRLRTLLYAARSTRRICPANARSRRTHRARHRVVPQSPARSREAKRSRPPLARRT